MFRCMRLPSTFSALNLRLLWLTEPLPTSALIVLFIKSHFLSLSGRSRGSVTLVKSNAKALLTGKPIKNATCKQVLRSPRGKGGFLKKSPLHPAKTLSVTVCDDSDGIFDTTPTHKIIVTPSHIVTPAPIGIALLFALSDCGCSYRRCCTRLAAAPH